MSKEVLGVLCSGRGSNLQSIMDAIAKGQITAPIGVVIANKPDAKALERAEQAGIPHVCIDHRKCVSQREFEERLVEALKDHGVTLVILAGFMRILSPYFVHEFSGRIMNIHPSLLPSFGGAHAHRDVLAYGVKVSGCTIHFVDEGMDSGPIILQATVPVLDDDDEDTLAARVLEQEHILYPRAIELFLNGLLTVEGRKVKLKK